MQFKLFSAVALASIFALSACSDDNGSSKVSDRYAQKHVLLGVVGENNDEWKAVAQRLESRGINLELVKFSDYTLPNGALAEGEIDLNAFQHKAYLNNDIKNHGYKFAIMSDTLLVPLAAYSDKIKSLDELKDGDTVAIPNDLTNGGRALKLLAEAGIIELQKGREYDSEVRDIAHYNIKIKLYEVDAGNTVSLIPDVAAAIVNSNFAVDNGLDPLKDPIYSDAQGEIDQDNPYVNVVIAREEDKDNALLQEIIKEYRHPKTVELIKKQYKNSAVAAFKVEE